MSSLFHTMFCNVCPSATHVRGRRDKGGICLDTPYGQGVGKVHPCAFFFHRLSPTELNYEIGNRDRSQTLNSRRACWCLFIGRFNFTLSYRPGSKNTKPGFFSLLFETPEKEVLILLWNVKRKVQEALRKCHILRGVPAGKLFCPLVLCSTVSPFLFAPGHI